MDLDRRKRVDSPLVCLNLVCCNSLCRGQRHAEARAMTLRAEELLCFTEGLSSPASTPFLAANPVRRITPELAAST